MRIVLDTSILVRSNERTYGLGRELLLHIVKSEHTLLLSNDMLFELARVLRYPRLTAFYGLTEDDVFEYVTFLRRASDTVVVDPLSAVPIRDANDIVVMQTAIKGKADILCTNDGDFFETAAQEYLNSQGIIVLDDIALMQRIRS